MWSGELTSHFVENPKYNNLIRFDAKNSTYRYSQIRFAHVLIVTKEHKQYFVEICPNGLWEKGPIRRKYQNIFQAIEFIEQEYQKQILLQL